MSSMSKHRRRKYLPGFTSQSILNRAFVRFALKHWKTCQWCGKEFTKSDPPTCEHIVPSSRKGSDHWSNLCLAHGSCNFKKGSLVGGARPFGPQNWDEVRKADVGGGDVAEVITNHTARDGVFVVWVRFNGTPWRKGYRGVIARCEREQRKAEKLDAEARILRDGEEP